MKKLSNGRKKKRKQSNGYHEHFPNIFGTHNSPNN